jgi:membrane peptidoglycan carboxypeptidase
MTSYGEDRSPRGRAQVGRAQVAGSPAGLPEDGPSGWPGSGAGGSGARGSRARAAVPGNGGRASVPGGGGRAAVPGNGAAVPGNGSRPGTVGRASVGPAAGTVGRASVGRVSAPPVSPAVPVGPMAPGGPMGPGGPGRPGGGMGPGGPGGPGGRPSPAALAKRRKKMRRRNLIIAAFAVFIMLAGGIVVGGTYYYDSVPAPQQLKLPEASTILYADGRTQLAKLGEEKGGNREYVPIAGIPDHVQKAVISAEDRNFFNHQGIDTRGILRAAWNNLSGGDTQGASTITQQYARQAANLTGITYARKLREAVIASKLNQEYPKEKILEFYLNTIYLGRGAYGIQAAARAYFNRTVDKLTPAEAAVLAAVIKQPEPSATHKGYDPTVNPAAAQERWTYVIDGMVKMGAIPAADQAKIQYPTTVLKQPSACVATATCGIDTPAGNVVNYVAAELAQLGISDLKAGGYRVTTTIDPKMQKAAQDAARPVKGSPMAGQPAKLMAALAAIDPETGRVKAYYGGDKGTGFDYAGLNTDEKNGALVGGHSPGSTFKIYTLAAALREDISTRSRWDATKTKDPDVSKDFEISNADRTPSCGNRCTLEEATIKSYNVPFYWITKEISPGKVVDAAKAAGIENMWTNENKAVNLTKVKGDEVAPSQFGLQVGFGQYGVTVLDHANGMATFAARGIYRKAHFVEKVEQRGTDGKYRVIAGAKETGERRFEEAQVDDLNAVLQKIPDANNDDLSGDRPATGKTGTWEWKQGSKENGDAWMVGATPQLATAVWIGSKGPARDPIRDKNNAKIGGSDLPAAVWKAFMDAALKGTDVKRFPPAANTGEDDRGNGRRPQEQPCFLPEPLCRNEGGNAGGGNDDDNRGTGRRGNGNNNGGFFNNGGG